jgi:HAMP domain-containing protein
VLGVAGTWKDLTESVNSMASNLTAQVRNIAEVSTAIANGDLSKKITGRCPRRDPAAEGDHQHHGGPAERLRLGSHARRAEVGTEGKLGGQAQVKGVAGTWKDLTDCVNSMASNLTARSATSPRSRRPSRAATCRRRSP